MSLEKRQKRNCASCSTKKNIFRRGTFVNLKLLQISEDAAINKLVFCNGCFEFAGHVKYLQETSSNGMYLNTDSSV
jgi:bifunctional ADP-heptose synthase (sugar kinase/adenylyltransferase)